mgnify:FL=1
MWRLHMKNVKCFRETAFTAFTFFDTSYSFTPNPDVWPQMFSAAAQHRAVEAKIMLAFKRFQSRLRPQRLKCRKKYEQRQQKSVVQSSYACSKGHHQSVVKVVSKMRVHTFRANKWQIKVLLVVFQKQLISKKTKNLDWA